MAKKDKMATAYVQSNEIVKEEDFTFGFDNIVNNVSIIAQAVLENTQDFVIGGKVKAYNTTDMNIVIEPIMGVCFSTGESFLDLATSDPITLKATSSVQTAIVEVQGTWEKYDIQSRAFNDYISDIKMYQDTETKKRLIVSSKVKYATGATAPTKDEGWVKIAEISIPANTTKASNCTFNNIDSNCIGIENSKWTNENRVTYNLETVSKFKNSFRQGHYADGNHKKNSISSSVLQIGTESGQLNASIIPSTGNLTVGDVTKAATDSIFSTLETISTLITSLWTYYIKNGQYKFNGAVEISSASNGIVKPLKLESDGNGKAYIKLNGTTLLMMELSSSGSYTIKVGDESKYSISTSSADSASTKLVTTAVTNALWNALTASNSRIKALEDTNDKTEYTNELFNRYNESDSYSVQLATTENINVTQCKTALIIDGKQTSDGYIVLVKDETDKKNNGIWQVSSNSLWTRVADYSTPQSFRYKIFKVLDGATNKERRFYCPTVNFKATTFGTDDIKFIYHKLLANIYAHRNNTSNPHGVTKAQVGLGNVPNVTTNGQTPTYNLATTTSELSSGERLDLAFGKIAKAIKDFISHVANISNPHSVTKAQVGLGNVTNVATESSITKDSLKNITSGAVYNSLHGYKFFNDISQIGLTEATTTKIIFDKMPNHSILIIDPIYDIGITDFPTGKTTYYGNLLIWKDYNQRGRAQLRGKEEKCMNYSMYMTDGGLTGVWIPDMVTTETITDKSVTTGKLADQAVTETKIGKDSVTTEKIKNSSITSDKIANKNITTNKFADKSVTTDKIADGNITEDKIKDGAVVDSKINDSVYAYSRNVFGICSVDAATQVKYVEIPNLKKSDLVNGIHIDVQFTNGSSYFYESGGSSNWGQCQDLHGEEGNASVNKIARAAAPKIKIKCKDGDSPEYYITVAGEYAGEGFVNPNEVHEFILTQIVDPIDGNTYSVFEDKTAINIYCNKNRNYTKKRDGLIEQRLYNYPSATKFFYFVPYNDRPIVLSIHLHDASYQDAYTGFVREIQTTFCRLASTGGTKVCAKIEGY